MKSIITQVIPFVKGDTIPSLEISLNSSLQQEVPFQTIIVVQGTEVKNDDLTSEIVDFMISQQNVIQKKGAGWLVRGLTEDVNYLECVENVALGINTPFISALACGDSYTTDKFTAELTRVFMERREAFEIEEGPFPPALWQIEIEGESAELSIRNFAFLMDAYKKVITANVEELANLGYAAKLEAIITRLNEEELKLEDRLKVEDAFYVMSECRVKETGE